MVSTLDKKLKCAYAHLRPKKGVSRRKKTRTSAQSNGKYLLLFKQIIAKSGVISFVFLVGVALIFAGRQLQAVRVGEVSYVGDASIADKDEAVFEEELHALVFDQLQSNYWSLDLNNLAIALESHPWVNRVTVKRQWPNKLVFGVDQHVPVARWNNKSLLLAAGNIIQVDNIAAFQYLPQFLGVASSLSSAEEVQFAVARFNELQREISDVNWQIQQMEFGGEGSIAIVLRDGPRIELGTQRYLQRLQRIKVMTQSGLIGDWQSLASIDARYRQGVAVGWRDATAQQSFMNLLPRQSLALH